MEAGLHEVSVLLVAWSKGDQTAREKLIPLVYRELRQLAYRQMAQERPGHSLQATALVNEAYLRLVNRADVSWQNRAQFFALAAQVMRNILVDYARQRNRIKRGGGGQRISLNEAVIVSGERAEELVSLDDALTIGSTSMKRILILAATLALAGCGPSEPKTDPAAEKGAIDKVRDDFIAAFNAGDAMKIGEVYAENAVMMPGDKPTVTGRAAIVDYNKATFDQASAKIKITPLHTTVSGEIAIDEGTYTISVTPKAAGSQPIMEEGRYVVVLQKMAGSWKIIDDIDNRSKAAAPPPPPAGKKKAPAPAASKAPASKSKTKGK